MAKSNKIRFRDNMAQFESIRNDIATRKFAPIYLFMGEEGYFIDELSNQLAQTILPEEQQAFCQITAYGKDYSSGQIVAMCRQMPMGGNYQVVIVKEAQSLSSGKIEDIAAYTKSPALTTILIICHKDKSVDKRSQLYKTCSANGIVFESTRPNSTEINSWLIAFTHNKGLKIDPKAVSMLVEHLGVDISKISNEIDKLILALPNGILSITPEHIEQFVGISKDFNQYEFSNAVTAREVDKALLIAEVMTQAKKSGVMIVVIRSLFFSFKQIFIYKYMEWAQIKQRQPMPDSSSLCRIMGLPFPSQLEGVIRKSSQWSLAQAFAVLGILREYDAKSKGYNSGDAGEAELLREIVLKIFMS